MEPQELLILLIDGHRGLSEPEKAVAKEAAADLAFRLKWAEVQIQQLRGMVGHLMHQNESAGAVPSPPQDAPEPPRLADFTLTESQPVQQPGYGG